MEKEILGSHAKSGFSFGLTSSIITTLGLIVGLNAGTHSTAVVLGGIIMIAVADSMSDALAMHISQESENRHTPKGVWVSTFSTLFAKFGFAMIFAVPVLLLDLGTAINASIVLGFTLLGVFSYIVAKQEKESAWKVVGEHLGIAIVVIVLADLAGKWVAVTFV